MCRHLAYVGKPVRVGSLLVDPPHSLLSQAWAPRRQTHGVVNADGCGLGWYADGDPVPARHRSAAPAWADSTFADLARVVRAPALLAAVRSATTGMPDGVAASLPFRNGRWLCSHNGAVDGWPGAAEGLAALLRPADLLALDAVSDAALLWALVHRRLAAGEPAPQAVGGVVAEVAAACGGRLNLLVTDGQAVTATAYGASLCWRALPDGVVVASEPYDDGPGWADVPDRSLVSAGPDGVTVTPL